MKTANPREATESPEESYSLAEAMPRFWTKVQPLVQSLAESVAEVSSGLLIMIPNRTKSSEIYLLVNGGFYSGFLKRDVTVTEAMKGLCLRTDVQLRRVILTTILQLTEQRYEKLPERIEKTSTAATEFARLFKLVSQLIIKELVQYR